MIQNQSQNKSTGKKALNINAFVLLFFVIVISAILTYIVPAGEFDRVEKDGRTLVVPDSFTLTESSPVGFFNIFTSIHSGMIDGAGIIFFVLIIGGAFGILKATGALDALIVNITRKLANRELLLIPVLMLFFSVGGTLMGMAEETIVYIAIITPVAIALKLDAMVGFAIVSLGANIGFMSAVLNPFNIGVAQSIAELPTFSGIGLRLVLFATLYIAGVLYVYRYAKKVKSNPELRYLGKYQEGNQMEVNTNLRLTIRHKWILTIFLLNFVVLIFGVIKFGWYITEIAGLFLLFGVLIGIVGKLNPNNIADSFIDGAKDLIGGALIIGFAQAILVVIQDGKLIDSVLYFASTFLSQLSPILNAIGMFFLQLSLNFLVPSGSGQAALTMPILAPLSDLVGVTRQTAVLAFQLGDGISNSLFPTSGVLLAGLAVAGIPFTKWIKWILPFIFIQIVISIIFLIIAQVIQYGPF
ncbi:YfcC family protein [Peribacillus loiseleuriae]|uniref:C4-dicarboxylate ABC transporter permease n=1 Tax=Peribacillus loiseleuriae TaxID=1679170 RepID=A0A0K9H037_9BACI|nr:C4-dicarboxylate ABC transporter permease [Peribacillus loiseleuriae]